LSIKTVVKIASVVDDYQFQFPRPWETSHNMKFFQSKPSPPTTENDTPLPEGLTQRVKPEHSAHGDYAPRQPSSLSISSSPMGGRNSPSDIQARRQPRAFKSYRLRGE
jgi:hypothetical protein